MFMFVLSCAFTLFYCGSQISAAVLGENVQATDLTINNVHGTHGHYTFLKAYLANDQGKPVQNKSIIFKVDGDPNYYIAVTNTNGHALLYYYVSQNQGIYSIKAEFKGDEKFSASKGEGVLTIL